MRLLPRARMVCLLASAIFIAACQDSSDLVNTQPPPPPPPPSPAGMAMVTPGINPAFDTVDEIATSDAAGGAYSANAEATYDAAAESVTFPDGAIPDGGLFVRLTGTATIGGVTSTYTIYTHVASNTTEVAANELTSVAVGLVADGTATDFDDGVDQVASATDGVEAAAIVAPSTAADRDAAVSAAMMAISNQFENSAFVPGTTDAAVANASVGQCIARGGLAWDNMSKVDAGGTGVLPIGEPNGDYQRCKACHGWDQLGTDGGYARRSRKDSRPNAGFGDPNTVSRNIRGGPISLDMVLHAGTGRSWAEGSAVFDTTDPEWGPGAQKGNEHPDLSPSGVNNPDVPSSEQIRCLTAFLNYPEARADAVFALINPHTDPADPVPAWCTSSQCTEYTLRSTADAAAGEAWYNDAAGGNCVTCHGQPEDEVGPIAEGPEGGLLAFLRQDGKYSEFRHKVHWGEAGDPLMTRANMNNPTAADVANVLAYLQNQIEEGVTEEMMAMVELGGLAWDNMSKVDAGGTGVLPIGEPNGDYQRCKACHGWDQLGTDGGYARRSRTASRPNAGFGDPNTVSRNISNDTAFGNVSGPITEAMILHAGTGRSWAEGTAVFDTTDPWGPGAQKGNEHPDLSTGGVNGTDVPSAEQIAGLAAFLNYPDARINAVFSAIDPDPAVVPEWCTSTQCTDYTVVSTADAARGETWYNDPTGGSCVTCHGEPEDEVGPIAEGPEGGLLAFLRQDGKFSEFRHKVQWGEAGDALMTRANMNSPTAADVADVLAYLQDRIDAQVAGPVGDPVAGQARYDAECGVCHAATTHDATTALGGNDIGNRGAELLAAGLLVNNMVDIDPTMVGLVLTDQDIADMVAFLDSL